MREKHKAIHAATSRHFLAPGSGKSISQLHLHESRSTTISKVTAKVFFGAVIFIFNLVQIPKLGEVSPM
jgi:hypothetical protein